MPEQRQDEGNPPPEESTIRRILGVLQQIFLAWTVMQLMTRFFGPQTNSTTPQNTSPSSVADALTQPPKTIELSPDWGLGQVFDIHVYLSDSKDGNIFQQKQHIRGLPNFVWENITFGDWTESRSVTFDVTFPESVLNNGTLWADVFIVKEHADPDYTKQSRYQPSNVHHIRKALTTYIARPKVRKERNLLTAVDIEDEHEEEEPEVIVPHWHENVTFALISQGNSLAYNGVPAPLAENLVLVPGPRDATGTKAYYYPTLFHNEFWRLRSQYMEINSTTPTLPLQITFQPMSFTMFHIFATMTHGFKEAAKQQGGAATSELDEIKRMFLETQPWLLILTGTVSVLHVVFEMLAFKNDVSHWRNKKEMVGVSVRTIVTNVFVQIVVLLYLIDNNENTSWMILFGSGMGVLIEAWKITKAVDISVAPAPAGSVLPYTLSVKDKHVLSADEKKTQEYDKLAFRYVSYVAIPALLIYTIYSLLYETHRGWYSFIITTLTSFVYMFGFVQLVPQLIINYKLKSVAHMPMKAMIYKTLSTVVDDLFAFCIKMPFLHRLACFRDDVVFLVFLYQRWIYRVDPKRVNEYGQVLAEDVDGANKVTAGAADGESKKDR